MFAVARHDAPHANDARDEVVRLGYRPALDGIRGVAIASVVSMHAFGWPIHGALGVDLFFVLSGFLITTLLLQEHGASGRIDIFRFYLRRARRLLPALFVMLSIYGTVIVVVFAARGELDRVVHRFVGLGSVVGYFANLFALHGGHLPESLSALWSLSQEEQFYAIWPLALIAVVRVRPKLLAPLLSIAIIGLAVERFHLISSASGFYRVYLGPDTHSEPILVGCLFGVWFVRGHFRSSRASSAASLVSLALVLLMIAVIAHLESFNDARFLYGSPVLTLFAVASAVVIVDASHGRSLVARALATRPLRFLGEISYSLYLWHLPVLVALSAVATPGLRSVAGLALAVFLACASRYFVELPLLRRGKRRPRQIGDAVPSPVPA